MTTIKQCTTKMSTILIDRQRRRKWRQLADVKTMFIVALTLFTLTSTVMCDQPTSPRRDIASISASQLNRNRNLRQTYESGSLEYREIVPNHSFPMYDDDYGIKRNNTDNRKPSFYSCKDYAPSVKEEQPAGTFVFKVEAHDPDDDTITYSFEKALSERAKFRINAKTGEIVTAYTFDRDEPIREKEVS